MAAIYTLNAIKPLRCDSCNAIEIIKMEPMTGTIKEIENEIEDVIGGLIEEAGWKDGCCPACAFSERDYLRDLSKADDRD